MGGNVSHPSNNPDRLQSCRKIHNPGHHHKKDLEHFPERVVSIFQTRGPAARRSASSDDRISGRQWRE